MMKLLIRTPARFLWRSSAPLRKRLAAAIEARLDPYITIAAESIADRSNMELDLAACEVARLSHQIDTITNRLHNPPRP